MRSLWLLRFVEPEWYICLKALFRRLVIDNGLLLSEGVILSLLTMGHEFFEDNCIIPELKTHWEKAYEASRQTNPDIGA